MITTNLSDPYLESKYYTDSMWVALLSNGQTVYMDDGNPVYEEPSAWIRLKKYCAENGVYIVGVNLQFRSHTISPLPNNKDGYFMRTGIMGFLNGLNIRFFLAGYLENNEVKIIRIGAPELLPLEKEIRSPDDDLGVGPSLIRKNNDSK